MKTPNISRNKLDIAQRAKLIVDQAVGEIPKLTLKTPGISPAERSALERKAALAIVMFHGAGQHARILRS